MKYFLWSIALLFATACGSKNDGGDRRTAGSIIGQWENMAGIDNAPEDEIVGGARLIFETLPGYSDHPETGLAQVLYKDGGLNLNYFHIRAPGVIHLGVDDQTGWLVYEYWVKEDILYFRFKECTGSGRTAPPVGTLYSYREYTPESEFGEEELLSIEEHVKLFQDALDGLKQEIALLEAELAAETDPYKIENLNRRLQEKKNKRDQMERMLQEVKEEWGLT